MTEPVTYQYTGLIVDGHIDLAYNAVVLNRNLQLAVGDIRRWEFKHPSLDKNAGTCTVSIPALLAGKVAVIGSSIFVEPAVKSRPTPLPVYKTPDEARQLAIQQLDYYNQLADEYEQVQVIRELTDLDDVIRSWETNNPILGLFIVMEGAEAIDNPDRIPWWFDHGVRGVGLTWSLGTRYAGGNAAPGPLTDEGKALLDVMADYGMLLDISHMWIDAAHEALTRYPGIVVATHANPRHFSNTPRQLPDEIIHLI
ncbi:MAG: membrane dipeptidase, partial [Anaerolineae bacterium]|nr:membrane dipeptidase [Anaerolineae bacterium]